MKNSYFVLGTVAFVVLSFRAVNGQNPVCNVCGGEPNATLSNPGFIVDLSDVEWFAVASATCQELFEFGLAGFFTPRQCDETQFDSFGIQTQKDCGCSTVSEGTPSPTEAAGDSGPPVTTPPNVEVTFGPASDIPVAAPTSATDRPGTGSTTDPPSEESSTDGDPISDVPTVAPQNSDGPIVAPSPIGEPTPTAPSAPAVVDPTIVQSPSRDIAPISSTSSRVGTHTLLFTSPTIFVIILVTSRFIL